MNLYVMICCFSQTLKWIVWLSGFGCIGLAILSCVFYEIVIYECYDRCSKDCECGLLRNVAKVSTFICIYLYREVNMNYVRPVGVNSC